MRKCISWMAFVWVLITSVTALAGSETPDLKGTWVWQDQGARHYRSAEPLGKTHLKDKIPYPDISFTMNIDKQDGFRFSGTKSSANWTESISGVVGFDNETVYMVDDNGFSFCRLVSPDKMEQIYLHITDKHSVASRGILIRKR